MKNITTIKPHFYINNKRIKNLKHLENYVIEFEHIKSNEQKLDHDLFQSFYDYSLQTFIWNEEGFKVFSNPKQEFNYWVNSYTLDKLTPEIVSSFFDDVFIERNY